MGPAQTGRRKVQRSGQGIAAQKAFLAARTKAYRRLAQLHPDEFAALVEDEKRAAGITPLPMGRPKVDA